MSANYYILNICIISTIIYLHKTFINKVFLCFFPSLQSFTNKKDTFTEKPNLPESNGGFQAVVWTGRKSSTKKMNM
jgi:hypothetical protein